jgi:hypothetical protein
LLEFDLTDRITWDTVLANAAEAGVVLPPTMSLDGLQHQDLWPFED